MRTILIILFVIVYLIVTLPALLVFWLIAKKDAKKAERYVHTFIVWAFRCINTLAGVDPVITGLENVPKDQPVLYIGNHCSYFDILITYPLCTLPTSYVAKDGLKKIPLFNVWGTLMRCLFFNRNDVKQSLKMIRDAVECLKTDTSVFIFPEGTRNKSGSCLPLGEFHNGSFKPAVRSGAPIIPVALKNTANIWESHMPWVRKTKVFVEYGRPIFLADLDPADKKNSGSYMRNVLEEMLSRE